MESVRKAAEMVIEEVQIKGNSKCFLSLCVCNAGQFYTRPLVVVFTYAEATTVRQMTFFCTVKRNESN